MPDELSTTVTAEHKFEAAPNQPRSIDSRFMQKEQVTEREAAPAEAAVSSTDVAATPNTTMDAVVGKLVEEAAQSTAHEDASAVVDPASS
eukprot:6362760-Amphidinium_carterae.1